MSTLDKLWKGISDTIKLNDKVEQLAGVVAKHQLHIENITERLTRLEARFDTTIQIAGMLRGPNRN